MEKFSIGMELVSDIIEDKERAELQGLEQSVDTVASFMELVRGIDYNMPPEQVEYELKLFLKDLEKTVEPLPLEEASPWSSERIAVTMRTWAKDLINKNRAVHARYETKDEMVAAIDPFFDNEIKKRHLKVAKGAFTIFVRVAYDHFDQIDDLHTKANVLGTFCKGTPFVVVKDELIDEELQKVTERHEEKHCLTDSIADVTPASKRVQQALKRLRGGVFDGTVFDPANMIDAIQAEFIAEEEDFVRSGWKRHGTPHFEIKEISRLINEFIESSDAILARRELRNLPDKLKELFERVMGDMKAGSRLVKELSEKFKNPALTAALKEDYSSLLIVLKPTEYHKITKFFEHKYGAENVEHALAIIEKRQNRKKSVEREVA